ncbi:MAG: hypothetical protein OXT71_10510 [Acidobacteriota bacterium]|nr:hypothetical protein [Acidobacteriota bacterium]
MARKKSRPANLGGGVIVAARLSIMRHNIGRLKNFYDEGERHFKRGFKDLEDEIAHLTDDEIEVFHLEYRDELEDLREIKRNFSIFGLFTVIERFLRRTLRHLRKAGAPVEGCIRKMSLEGMKDAFRKIGVPITEPNHDWHALMGMKEVRNCIAHYDGHPHKEMAKKLQCDYKIPVIEERWKPANGGKFEPISWSIQLADEYFGESAELVERVCKRAARGYSQFM